MVELLGKSLIQHQIETLRRNGVDDIHIATGYLEEKIDFENMFMTIFLQMISDNLSPLTPVFINNGWMEVDTPSDLDFHNFLH